MQRQAFFFFLLLLSPGTGPGFSQNIPQRSSKSEIAPIQPEADEIWAALLDRYVDPEQGLVDYQGLKKDRKKLNDYLDHLKNHPPQNTWSRNRQMAYWINAYNAFTLQLVLDHYPIASIRDLDKGNPWDVSRIEIGTKRYSLNQIEKEMLLGTFRDPRIHFVINCAARSCPPLWNKAFEEAHLESMLDAAARRFINHPRYNTLSASSIRISRIFDWYAKDFGNLVTFLNRYATTRIKPDAKIRFQEYDWNLNRK